MTAHDNLRFIQQAREAAMVTSGNERAIERDKRAAAAMDQTRAERLTIAGLIPAAHQFLDTLLGHYETAGGRRPDWHAILKGLDLEEVAAAAVRAGFAAALKNLPIPRALILAGKHVEIIWGHSALRVRAKTGAARKRIAMLTKGKATQEARRRSVARAVKLIPQSALGDTPGVPERGELGWADDTLMKAGEPLISAAIATGLFHVVTSTTKRGKGRKETTTNTLGLTAEGEALLAEVADLGLLTRPLMRPMLVPPKPWVALKGGAYHTEAVNSHLSFVRGARGPQRKLLARGVRDGSLRPAMEVVSAIQSVPLQIDAAVLALRQWAIETDLDIPDVLPLRTPVAIPDVPADIDKLPLGTQRRLWAQRSRASRINAGIGPNMAAFNAITAEAAELLAAGTPFYQPHSLDFRGRVYPVAFFSHQGGDASRSLVRFHNALPLGDDGLFWLQVHVANCGDFPVEVGGGGQGRQSVQAPVLGACPLGGGTPRRYHTSRRRRPAGEPPMAPG